MADSGEQAAASAAVSEKVTVVQPDDYEGPIEDPYNKAISYLERHNILQLFQHLTSDVIYNRPSDPLDYLINEVQQLKQKRDSGAATKK